MIVITNQRLAFALAVPNSWAGKSSCATKASIANRGNFKGEQILACQEAGITAIVPKTSTSAAKADGRFDKADFSYDPTADDYRCPANQRLVWRFSRVEGGLMMNRYWRSACPRCAIKAQCTPSDYRGASAAGNIKRCSMPWNADRIGHLSACAFADRRSSILSESLRPGWAPPINFFRPA